MEVFTGFVCLYLANRQAEKCHALLEVIQIQVPEKKMKKGTAHEDKCVCHSYSREG
jgi:hypothetical protein